MNIRKAGAVAICAILSLSTAQIQAQSYTVVATGQTKSYNIDGEVMTTKKGKALYGQDADYQAGPAMSFKDNGDGTVSDLNTGLEWQQIPTPQGMTWAEAKAYCESLELGGHSDWRLPTLKELFSISNFSAGWPYIDTNYFKLSSEQVSKDEQYWADNMYAGETVEGHNNAAFGVNHVTGHIKAYPAGGNRGGGERGEQGEQRQQRPQGQRPEGADSTMRRQPPMMAGREQRTQGEQSQQRPQGQQRPQMGGQGGNGGQGGAPMMNNPMAKQVRAVRGEVYGINQFVDNADGTITDKATGLMWSKGDNGKGIEWHEALEYAENSKLAGYKDWRLPNIKELQSIADYTRAPSSKGVEAAMDPIFTNTPYVNEAGDDDFGYCWSSTSACFRKDSPFYFAWYLAVGRAVNNAGKDMHGAGAVRFDSKSDNGLEVEGGEERYYNFVRLVRTAK